jgi:hypothetical protein
MAARDYKSLDDICDNLRYQIEDVVGLELVVGAIAALQLANPVWAIENLTTDDRNNMLRKLTGCVVGTMSNVNCYPMGYEQTVLFDLNGDPVI